jgi:hypothetical protein
MPKQGFTSTAEGVTMGEEEPMSEQACRHGVPLRTTKVWNEACWRCREEAEAYERQGRRLGAWETKKQMMGRYDRTDRARGTDSKRWYGEETRAYWSRFWSAIWKDRRGLGIERRAEWVRRVLADDPDVRPKPVMPEWLERLMDEHAGKFTPAQRMALELSYAKHLTLSEAAAEASRRLGREVTKSAYRKWLRGAKRAVDYVLEAEAQGRTSRVRRGRNAGRAG